jgi:hypothetical protein
MFHNTTLHPHLSRQQFKLDRKTAVSKTRGTSRASFPPSIQTRAVNSACQNSGITTTAHASFPPTIQTRSVKSFFQNSGITTTAHASFPPTIQTRSVNSAFQNSGNPIIITTTNNFPANNSNSSGEERFPKLGKPNYH